VAPRWPGCPGNRRLSGPGRAADRPPGRRWLARSIREHTLLARTPALEEIDGPLPFLAIAASSYMTGQVLVIDGG
jgi:NAD(P)-dependent dehydrogenase (short-subunit alcohol dehydrogenase family)